ncbi:hypothetical protein Tco_0469686 [Tanacetum coccineum]
MATSWMCCSVGILFHHSRLFIKVNAQQGDHVDEVMLISKTSEEECNQEFEAIFQDYEDIQSMLFDDYKTLQMELTIDHGAVDTVRLFNEFGQELDGEHNQKVSMEIAKLALWYDSCRDSGFSDVKAFENSLKITGFSKEKEDVGEICVICNEEYKVGEMTATMECEEHLFSSNKLHAILINSLLSLLALVIFDRKPGCYRCAGTFADLKEFHWYLNHRFIHDQHAIAKETGMRLEHKYLIALIWKFDVSPFMVLNIVILNDAMVKSDVFVTRLDNGFSFFIRKANNKKGPEDQQETRKAYDFTSVMLDFTLLLACADRVYKLFKILGLTTVEKLIVRDPHSYHLITTQSGCFQAFAAGMIMSEDDRLRTSNHAIADAYRSESSPLAFSAEEPLLFVWKQTAFTSKKDYGKEETMGSCSKDTPRTLDTSNLKYLQQKATGLSEIA